jgi:vitamin B12 transporter
LDLYAMFRNHAELKDIDKSAYVDDDNATIDFRRRLWTYGATYRFNDRANLKLTGGYSDMRRVAVDDSSVVGPSGATDHTFSDTKYSGTMQTNELQATVRLSNLEFIIGAGVYRESMSVQSYFTTSSVFGLFEYSSNLDSLALSATTRDLFAQLDVNGTAFAAGWERLSLIVGARWNRQSAFGDYTTLEFNPAYRIGDAHLLYGSYSTGFNAPSLYQLYTPERDYSSDITRGNRSLQPERSQSLEIGWKYFPGNDARYSVSYVRTRVENSIEYVYLWDKNVSIEQIGQDYLRNDFRGDTYLNLGSQTTDGVEATASIRLSEHFSFSGNITLLRGKLEYRPSEIDQDKTHGHHVQLYSNGAFMTQDIQSTDLVRRPATIHLSFIYRPIDAWTTRLDVKHAGQRSDVYYDFQRGPYGALGTQPVDAYTLVDLTQHVQLNRNWAANLRVENLFNKEYLEIKGFTTRGRGVYFNVRYQWDTLL